MGFLKKDFFLALVVAYTTIAAAFDNDSGVVKPLCQEPIPLYGNYDPQAPGYIVMLNVSDIATEMARLVAHYGFEVKVSLETISSFSAEMTPEVVAKLRCEPTVKWIGHNSAVHAASKSIHNRSLDYAPAALERRDVNLAVSY